MSIRYARWEPPSGRKGTVCIFQGRTEFIEKYFELVRDLRARGFAVATIDWRGQGLSQRRLRDSCKGHVRSFAEYDIDLETFVQEIVLPDCPPPFFALGHSMGAAVLMRAAAHGHRWFDRMVLMRAADPAHQHPDAVGRADAGAELAARWDWGAAMCRAAARGAPRPCLSPTIP